MLSPVTTAGALVACARKFVSICIYADTDCSAKGATIVVATKIIVANERSIAAVNMDLFFLLLRCLI
jgi:hypothetical protein